MAEDWRRDNDGNWIRTPRIVADNLVDANGRPAGGWVEGSGLTVQWQNGPVLTTGHHGAFVEDLIDACIGRLEFYQAGEFKCLENSAAIDALRGALVSLEARTRGRLDRGVEGTYEP